MKARILTAAMFFAAIAAYSADFKEGMLYYNITSYTDSTAAYSVSGIPVGSDYTGLTIERRVSSIRKVIRHTR